MLSLLVCVPFAGALLISSSASRLRVQPAWFAGLTVMLGLALLLTQGLPVYGGEVLLELPAGKLDGAAFTVIFSVAVSLPPWPSPTVTVKLFRPTSAFAGVPDSVPSDATLSQAGPATLL